MKEKEKGKINPFVGELRPGEEILWFYASSSSLAWVELFKKMLRIMIMLLFALALCVDGFLFIQGLLLSDNILLNVSLVLLAFIALLAVAMMYPFSLLRASQPHVFAVTNERLLSHVRGKVTSLPLEEVDILYMSSSEEGHLFFSLSLPEWRNIPHPEDVLEIIAQAQEQRIHRLDSEQEDWHENERKREGQVQSVYKRAASG